MNWLTGLIFYLVVFLSGSHCQKEGKQRVYSYHALLRSGTLLPWEAHSQWDLHAFLTITDFNNVTIMQLRNVTTSIYNGLRDGVPEDMHPSAVPKEAKVLSDPFIVHFTGTQVDDISVDADEPLWSVNMKRAIASILQVKLDQLNTSASFITENNIYGRCENVEYSVVNNTEYVYVRKVIDQSTCSGFPSIKWSNVDPFYCQEDGYDSFSSSITREYTLQPKDGQFELKHVLASRRLYVQPFRGNGEAHQVYQYQVYQLINTETVNSLDGLRIKNPIRKSLTFEHNYREMLQGRNKNIKQDNVIKNIYLHLKAIIYTLEKPKLEPNTTELHNKLLTYLYYNSHLLNMDSFRKMYADISIGTSYQRETLRNLFVELLPQIGTEDGVIFIKELIVKRLLKDFTAIKLLAVFPFYVRHYSVKLLNDLEVLLNLNDNYNIKIKETAILSFATLVHKTCMAGHCEVDTLEKYGLRYFNLFSESTNYELRMVYLQGMDNMQIPSSSIFDYFTSIIKNNEQSRHIRFLAVWTLMNSAIFRPNQIYELFWPILIDRTQHLEMRVAAFTMLLIAQQTRSRLLTLFWYMQGETDPHLYNFFYTTMISLQQTTYPCYKSLSKLAAHVSRFLKPPRIHQHWMTGNYIFDYADTERIFGGEIHLFLIGNPISDAPNVAYFVVNDYASGKNMKQVSVYLKLEGVADHVRESLKEEAVTLMRVEKLMKLLEKSNVKLVTPEKVHVELIIKVHSKTVFCHHYDSTELKKLENALRILKRLEYHTNYQNIILPYIEEHIETSDVGTIIYKGIVTNGLVSLRGNFTDNIDFDFRYYSHGTNLLEVFNPVDNTWNGIDKSRSLQSRVLFNGTFSFDGQNKTIELSEDRGNDDYVSLLSHSESHTYILNDPRNKLKDHCPDCVNPYVVSGNAKKRNEDLLNIPFETFGTRFTVSIFDCEKTEDYELLKFFRSHRSNSKVLPLLTPVLVVLHLGDYVSYISPTKSCGVSVFLKPFSPDPSKLSFAMSLRQYSTPTSLVDPDKGLELSNTLTLTHRKLPDGPDLQFWNAACHVSSESGKRISNANVTIDHKNANGERQRFCLRAQMYLPERHADLFSLKISDDMRIKYTATWGKHEEDNSDCPANGATLESEWTASITDEQKQIASDGDKWPFKQCRENSIGHKFTPITMACYLASKEVATYRRYLMNTTFSNIPDWLTSAIQKQQFLMGLVQKNPVENDPMGTKTSKEKEKAKLTQTVAVEFSASEPTVTVSLATDAQAEKKVTADYSFLRQIDSFLINPRFLLQYDWNVNLGLSKVCVLTPTTLTTVDNRTLSLEEIKLRKKDVLLTADCTRHPKFAVLLESDSEVPDLGFSVHAGTDSLSVRHADRVEISLNGKRDAERESSYLNVWRLDDDVVLIRTKQGDPGTDIYYTKEYMVITQTGYYTGSYCGICGSIKNNNAV